MADNGSFAELPPTLDLILPPEDQEEQSPVWDYTIDLGDREFRITLRYNERLDSWYLDLYDADGNALILGKRLVSENVLIQAFTPLIQNPIWTDPATYQGGGDDSEQQRRILAVLDLEDTGREPQYEDLGRSHKLYYLRVIDLLIHLIQEDALPEGFAFDAVRVESVTIIP